MIDIAKHLDTLVGPKSHLYYELYDLMLHISVTYTIGDVVDIGKFHIEVCGPEATSDMVYKILYNGHWCWIHRANVSSYVYPEKNDNRYASLDEKCNLVLHNLGINDEPWEISN